MPFVGVKKWVDEQPESQWEHVIVRDGAKGPLEVDVMICRVQAKIDRRVGGEERLVVIRFVNEGSIQHDYYLTNADGSVTAKEYARVSKLGHTIEEEFKQAKSECGLADYQVRNWCGWHHHVTMSLVTSWCLTQETFVQKKACRHRKHASLVPLSLDPVFPQHSLPSRADLRFAEQENILCKVNKSNQCWTRNKE